MPKEPYPLDISFDNSCFPVEHRNDVGSQSLRRTISVAYPETQLISHYHLMTIHAPSQYARRCEQVTLSLSKVRVNALNFESIRCVVVTLTMCKWIRIVKTFLIRMFTLLSVS